MKYPPMRRGKCVACKCQTPNRARQIVDGSNASSLKSSSENIWRTLAFARSALATGIHLTGDPYRPNRPTFATWTVAIALCWRSGSNSKMDEIMDHVPKLLRNGNEKTDSRAGNNGESPNSLAIIRIVWCVISSPLCQTLCRSTRTYALRSWFGLLGPAKRVWSYFASTGIV